MKELVKGIYPAMVTAFTPDEQLDDEANARMVDWYADAGVQGLFACCASSQMFDLSQPEQLHLTKTVIAQARRRGLQVIASGHVAEDFHTQLHDMQEMAELEPDALVLVPSVLVGKEESDDEFKRRVECFLKAIPDATFGLYECPAPYHRLLSPELLKWCVDTGRFSCMKDTSCRVEAMAAKLQALEGKPFALLNACTETLLDTLDLGAAGHCGVMGNVHPRLYVRLMELQKTNHAAAQRLQHILTTLSTAACTCYPFSAKYTMRMDGVPVEINMRGGRGETLSPMQMLQMQSIKAFTDDLIAQVEGW